jgi:hypothetical protein
MIDQHVLRPAASMAGTARPWCFRGNCAWPILIREYRWGRTCRRISRRGTRGGSPSSDRNWSDSGPTHCGEIRSRNYPTLERCYKERLRSLRMQ